MMDNRMGDTMGEEELPLELQLDLLVDEELPDPERKTLLKRLDREPGQWRKLSLRFLERQVERRGIKKALVDGRVSTNSAPVPQLRIAGGLREDGVGRTGHYGFPALKIMSFRGRAIAAGLLIAATSATVTLLVTQHPQVGGNSGMIASSDHPQMMDVSLPTEVTGEKNLKVPVSMRDGSADQALFSPSGNGSSHQSTVIKPDGHGNAYVIPVSTMKVY